MGNTGSDEISIYLIICGILGMLLLAIGIVVFVLIHQKKIVAHEKRLQDAKLNHRQDLLNHIVQTQEKERTRIARELHDGIGSLLSASRLFVSQLDIHSGEEDFINIQTESKNSIDEAIEDVRRISRDLLPRSLASHGLMSCVSDLAEKIEKADTIKINLTSANVDRLSIERELALFRITQELLNNTIKYAEATLVTINFTFDNGILNFRYQDNGKGFIYDPYQVDGLGLKNVESRALFLGSEIEIKTSHGQGMMVNLNINQNE